MPMENDETTSKTSFFITRIYNICKVKFCYKNFWGPVQYVDLVLYIYNFLHLYKDFSFYNSEQIWYENSSADYNNKAKYMYNLYK